MELNSKFDKLKGANVGTVKVKAEAYLEPSWISMMGLYFNQLTVIF